MAVSNKFIENFLDQAIITCDLATIKNFHSSFLFYLKDPRKINLILTEITTNYAHNIFDYIVENYCPKDDYVRLALQKHEYTLVEPIDVYSFEHAKFTALKNSIDEFGASYRILKFKERGDKVDVEVDQSKIHDSGS